VGVGGRGGGEKRPPDYEGLPVLPLPDHIDMSPLSRGDVKPGWSKESPDPTGPW